MRQSATRTWIRLRVAALSVITGGVLVVLTFAATVAPGPRVVASATDAKAGSEATHAAAPFIASQRVMPEVRRDPSVQSCQWVAGGSQQASACWNARPPYDWPNAGDGVNTPY